MKILFLFLAISCSNLDKDKKSLNLSLFNFISRFSRTSVQNITPVINPRVIISPSANFTTESGGQVQISVSLSERPSSGVRIDLSSSNLSEGIVTNSSLNFDSSNFSTIQIANLTGVADNTYDLVSPNYQVRVQITTTDVNYSNLQISDLNFINKEQGKLTFVTESDYTGNGLGGISGADNKCEIDSNKPAGISGFKAMLVDGITRRACLNPDCNPLANDIDWVFKANTKYFRKSDFQLVFTSNSLKIATFPLQNSFGSVAQYWTGLATTWVTTNDCADWLGTGSGEIGDNTSTSSASIRLIFSTCTGNQRLLCVEQ